MPKWVLVVPKWTKAAAKKRLAGKKLTTKKPVPKPKVEPKPKPKITPKKPWVLKAKPTMQRIKERLDRQKGIKPKDSGKALTKAPAKKSIKTPDKSKERVKRLAVKLITKLITKEKPKPKKVAKVDKKKKTV